MFTATFQKATLFLLSLTCLSAVQAQAPSFDETLMHARELMIFEDERAELARSHTKIDQALKAFLETDFMKKYKEIRLETESLVSTFKAHSGEFTPEDIASVKKSYTRMADQFNILLGDIKQDLMDKDKIKYIKKYPDLFSASIELKLRQLQDEHLQSFQKSVADVTGSDNYSAIPFAAIVGLVKLTVDFTNYLIRTNYESKRVKEEHLNTFLIEPFSFKTWENID